MAGSDRPLYFGPHGPPQNSTLSPATAQCAECDSEKYVHNVVIGIICTAVVIGILLIMFKQLCGRDEPSDQLPTRLIVDDDEPASANGVSAFTSVRPETGAPRAETSQKNNTAPALTPDGSFSITLVQRLN